MYAPLLLVVTMPSVAIGEIYSLMSQRRRSSNLFRRIQTLVGLVSNQRRCVEAGGQKVVSVRITAETVVSAPIPTSSISVCRAQPSPLTMVVATQGTGLDGCVVLTGANSTRLDSKDSCWNAVRNRLLAFKSYLSAHVWRSLCGWPLSYY